MYWHSVGNVLHAWSVQLHRSRFMASTPETQDGDCLTCNYYTSSGLRAVPADVGGCGCRHSVQWGYRSQKQRSSRWNSVYILLDTRCDNFWFDSRHVRFQSRSKSQNHRLLLTMTGSSWLCTNINKILLETRKKSTAKHLFGNSNIS